MILRRVIEHVRAQRSLPAASDVFRVMASVFVFLPLAPLSPAAANPMPSSEIAQDVLAACEARAEPFGGDDRTINEAAMALIDMGVFNATDFSDVKIGFCGLRAARGPVATTSCASDTILLDAGYAVDDEKLALKATLAHEMQHYFQHREQKAKFGDGYCESARYQADKAWMEAEADAFGDDVAALFFLGRATEITNDCPVPARVYLEADMPRAARDEFPGFVEVAANATAAAPERALSKFFRLYAEATPDEGRKRVWGGSAMSDKRAIDGKIYGLTPVALEAPSRSTGPFQLTLSCSADPDG